jgi:hypothetical protein
MPRADPKGPSRERSRAPWTRAGLPRKEWEQALRRASEEVGLAERHAADYLRASEGDFDPAEWESLQERIDHARDTTRRLARGDADAINRYREAFGEEPAVHGDGP